MGDDGVPKDELPSNIRRIDLSELYRRPTRAEGLRQTVTASAASLALGITGTIAVMRGQTPPPNPQGVKTATTWVDRQQKNETGQKVERLVIDMAGTGGFSSKVEAHRRELLDLTKWMAGHVSHDQTTMDRYNADYRKMESILNKLELQALTPPERAKFLAPVLFEMLKEVEKQYGSSHFRGITSDSESRDMTLRQMVSNILFRYSPESATANYKFQRQHDRAPDVYPLNEVIDRNIIPRSSALIDGYNRGRDSTVCR